MAIGTRPGSHGTDFNSLIRAGEQMLHEYYIKNKMAEATLYEEDPFYKMLAKEKAMRLAGGRNIVEDIDYTEDLGGSKSFSQAQAIAKGAERDFCTFTYVVDQDFAVGRVQNLAMYASADSKYSFIDVIKKKLDKVIKKLAQRRANDLWGNGQSVKGVVSAVSGKVITLSRFSDLPNFEKGFQFEIRPATAGANRGTVTVDKVSRVRGTPTITIVEAMPTGVVANDRLMTPGDYGVITMLGVQNIIPDVAPSQGDNLLGFDRSVDPLRLAGHRFTMGASDTYDSFLRECVTDQSLVVGSNVADTLWVNPVREKAIIDELGSKIRYNDPASSMAQLGYSGVKIVTPRGDLMLKTSIRVPVNKAYGFKMDTWSLKYLSAPGKGFVDFMPVEKFGGKGNWIIAYDDDGIECRLESYGALTCSAPGCNFVANLSAKTL